MKDHNLSVVDSYRFSAGGVRVAPTECAGAWTRFSIDTQVCEALCPLLSGVRVATRPAAGDWRARRAVIQRAYDRAARAIRPIDGINVDKFMTTAPDGTQLPLFLYRRADVDQPGSAALFLHGGGMIMGWHRVYDLLARAYVAASGVPLLAVHYRVAPEHQYPIPVEDCYTALVWIAKRATDLGIDPARIGVMGGSAGGGLAAGVTLLARDRGGPPVAQQLLLAPMLDDRTAISDPRLQHFLTWDYDDNSTGWGALLGDKAGREGVSPYAAPARADDLSELPPTYIDVGGLDIFWHEDLVYAGRLVAAGVPTEFHLHAGVPHGFEIFAPATEVARRAMDDRMRRLNSL